MTGGCILGKIFLGPAAKSAEPDHGPCICLWEKRWAKLHSKIEQGDQEDSDSEASCKDGGVLSTSESCR